jgi:hypothetical protein
MDARAIAEEQGGNPSQNASMMGFHFVTIHPAVFLCTGCLNYKK